MLPALRDSIVCPNCRRPDPEVISWVQLPLLLGVDYGEATMIVSEFCSGCWTIRRVGQHAVSPRLKG